MKKVGFIGLGSMGKPMAKRLVAAGFPLTVCGHTRREPVEEMKMLGAKEVKTPKEVAQASEVIITMVRDDAQTEKVIRGEAGVMDGIKSGSAIIIMSTVSATLCQQIAGEASTKGVAVLDSPVSGGTPAAEAGTLTFMVGGSEGVLSDCRPVLEAMGKNIFHLGDLGMGQAAKLANNTIALANVFVATEGLSLGTRAGIKQERLLELIRVSTGNSWVIQHWELIASLKKAHRPGGSLDMMYKDIALALDLAKELHVDLPLAALTMQLNVGRLP
ncbi:MAG: NAD(P)-dependent oxidoreductase [Chloroflexi bacterium]|nr:NAD(P)-dependent oxidoreductase [Chloroflexota bacterium]